MIDWPTMLAFVGIYIMLAGIFVHHFRTMKKLLVMAEKDAVINEAVLEISAMDHKILQLLKMKVHESEVDEED